MSADQRAYPHNKAAERSILGGVMRAPEWLAELSDMLRPEDFYAAEHQRLWEWMCAEREAGREIDAVTMFDRMPQPLWQRVGGLEYVIGLPDQVPTTANLGHYADVITELSSRRRMLSSCERWTELAYRPDPEGELLETVMEDLKHIGSPGAVRGEWIGDGLDDYIEENEAQMRSGTAPFIRLGWRDIDGLLKVSPGDLVILGARPGMGKTSWALNALMWRAGKLGETGGMFSLEMSRRQLLDRQVATRSGVPLDRVRCPSMRSEVDWDKCVKAENEIRKLPLLVDYRSSLTIEEIRAEARRWVTLHGASLIVVDYLQLMRATNPRDPREQQIAHMSRALKNMAKDLGIGVLALAQLNRKLESRPDKRPVVSDLRESGSLEQDADAIVFLYRDYQYTRSPTTKHDAEVLLRKQRNGPPGTRHLHWDGRTQLFKDAPTPEERRAAAIEAKRRAEEADSTKEPQDDSGKQQGLPTGSS